MNSILLAVPVFNEASKLREVIEEFGSIPNADIIFFDDGSDDDTLDILSNASMSYHSEPFNRGLAQNFQIILKHFLKSKNHKWLVTVDGDNQFKRDDIIRICSAISTGEFEYISGSRFLDKRTRVTVPKLRRYVNMLLAFVISKLAISHSQKKITDATCGLRAYTKSSAEVLIGIGGFSYTLESSIRLMKVRFRTKEVPVTVRYFRDRKSVISGSLSKYGQYILEAMTFAWLASLKRLVLGTLFFLMAVAVTILLTFFFNSVTTGTFRGWLYLASVGGFLLICSLLLTVISILISNTIELREKLILIVQSQQIAQLNLQLGETCPRCMNFPKQ